MKTAASGAEGGRNGFVPLGVGPMNRSEQSKFGALDVAVAVGRYAVGSAAEAERGVGLAAGAVRPGEARDAVVVLVRRVDRVAGQREGARVLARQPLPERSERPAGEWREPGHAVGVRVHDEDEALVVDLDRRAAQRCATRAGPRRRRDRDSGRDQQSSGHGSPPHEYKVTPREITLRAGSGSAR